jgi:hypothetical protein
MMRNSLVIAGLGAIVAVGLIQTGCSSTSDNGTGGSTGQGGSSAGQGGSSAGTGGSTGATGTGGSTGTTGTGGSTGTTGTGGSTGTTGTGGTTGALPICASPAPADKSACTVGAATCTKNCGANTTALLARAQKPCACLASATTAGAYAWDCTNSGACTYPASLTAMTACFHIPTPLTACPLDAGALIRPHASVCTNTPAGTCGTVCGSTTAPSYQDTSAAQKVGYCSCINGLWECASLTEWPTGV